MRRSKVRFSAMESLGFIETPTSVSDTRSAYESSFDTSQSKTQTLRGAHERTVADWEPTDITARLLRSRVRWGMVATLTVVLAGLLLAGGWLWQRPTALAEAATADVTAAAEALEPELIALRDLNQSLTDSDLDTSAVLSRSLTVDAKARELFNASGELTPGADAQRSEAAEVATTAIDASRLISDAVAYRSAVIPILVPPDLETDPERISLDQAIRDFGDWQQRFNAVRTALPDNTLSDVSERLELVSADLETVRGDYIEGLQSDDRVTATQVVEDLATRLSEVEAILNTSLTEVQQRAAALIEQSLSGIDELVD